MGNLSTPISVQKLQMALHAKAKTEAGFRRGSELLARTPQERADALYNLGNARTMGGNWRRAVEAYQAVLQMRRNDPWAKANLE